MAMIIVAQSLFDIDYSHMESVFMILTSSSTESTATLNGFIGTCGIHQTCSFLDSMLFLLSAPDRYRNTGQELLEEDATLCGYELGQ